MSVPKTTVIIPTDTIKNDSIQRHFEFQGIPIDNDIANFADKLYSAGYSLIEKDYENHLYKLKGENIEIWVNWDEKTKMVFMVQAIYLNAKQSEFDPYTLVDQYGTEPTPLNESYECIDVANGMIVLTDGDEKGHVVLYYVDKINSENYKLLQNVLNPY